MRFSRAAAAPDTDTNAIPRRRGLGPFSGGQLTAIIVTIAVMIMLPVGAWAVVTGSNVFVTDAVSGKQASVNTSGQLLTAENATSVVIASGSSSVSPNGNALLFVNGNVSAYDDLRIYVNETGAPPNHVVIHALSKAGSVNATLDQWTMTTNSETRRYETPGITLTLAAYNFDTVNTTTVTWTLVGRPN
jgi:hypothetical protein